ncbi:uncharacterized protein PV09_06313 [Verruconis gallopava]|uniref:Heterokaryon incompatibility domain-containing protein n=1 Tax=Verruconis gallopava TaxID=253628 RepID=A0A0D2ATT1_9PEZI|nr:uncharacterized protein PV09_06313 [Verruconis gallopava]KIW02514.1 hypothetical protein PV09_06313 [Verruconis gallopava]
MSARCSYCANLSFRYLIELAKEEFQAHLFPQRAYYQHHPSFNSLEVSAARGCDLCALILDCFKRSSPYTTPGLWPETWLAANVDEGKSMYSAAKQLNQSDIKIALNSSHPYFAEDIRSVQVFDSLLIQVGEIESPDDAEHVDEEQYPLPSLSLTLSTPRDYRIGRYQVDYDLRSDYNFNIARSWLQQCQSSHHTCQPKMAPILPTRIVDVGQDDRDDQPAKIVLGCGQRAEYLALSHCWGGKNSCSLDSTTLLDFQKAIPWAILPRNFQDAIIITRRLGFRFLWIDSLCILQDSKLDWARESKKMDSIYKLATLTISAMASSESNEGILKHHRRHEDPQPVIFTTSCDEGVLSDVMIARTEHELETLRSLDIRCPLSRRGWTLQELVLSERHLFFGKQHIYWKCLEGYQCPDGLPSGSRTADNAWNLTAITTRQNRFGSPTAIEHASLLHEWYELVTAYSSRQLTFDSDKLPALSGLANRFHRYFGGVYLAGIWSCDIIRGLIWSSELGSCPHVKPFRAPSWSWAVTNMPILYNHGPEHAGDEDLQIIDHKITLCDSGNPYGEILEAELIVKGRTVPLIRSRQTVHSWQASCYTGSVSFDEPSPEGIEERQDELVFFTYGAESRLLAVQSAPGNEYVWEPDQACFHTVEYLALLVHADFSSRVSMGLVLKIVDEKHDIFERVGFFSIDCEFDQISLWKHKQLRLV